MNNKPDGLVKLAEGDVYFWVEAQSSIMLKSITKSGDPVELNSEEVKELIRELTKMIARIE